MARSKPRTNKRAPPKAGARAAFLAAQARAQAEVEPSQPPPPQMQMDVLYANPAYFTGANGAPAAIPTDLPASLAALFEAKLNLDREKAKLVRMQKELRGYRESADRYAAQAKGQIAAHEHEHQCGECEYYDDGAEDEAHHGGEHLHAHEDDIDDECTCGRAHYHDGDEIEGEEGDDDGYYYYTSEEGEEDDMDGEHRHCEHELGHHHTCGHDHAHDDAQYEENLEMSYTAAFEAYAAERARALAAAEAGVVHGLGHVLPQQSQQSQPQWPRKRLADDPERLDEAVRELFNWIKAVVWTIEQAAGVAQRRGWTQANAQQARP